MIQPDDILRKARNIYPEFVRAWLSGDSEFFPRAIPAKRDPGDDVAAAIQLVSKLRNGSKEVLGFGYTVEWRKIRSRRLGRNLFPERILFAEEPDFLRFIRKEREFAELKAAVLKLREDFPELNPWVRGNVQTFLDVAENLDGLLQVLRHLRQHPRPQCFARELPVSLDTKFVGRHQSVLREWLDLVLMPHSIRADEEHFERRFGLRYIEPDIVFRFLDPFVQNELCFPCPVVSLPLETASALQVNASALIVENRVNLMTLPPIPRSLALWGLGNAATLFRYLPWLARHPITYWGDIDVEGFEILSRLRAIYPHVKSVFMDTDALKVFADLARPGSGRAPNKGAPPHLTTEEEEVFTHCATRNLRIEQEWIPQAIVVSTFAKAPSAAALIASDSLA